VVGLAGAMRLPTASQRPVRPEGRPLGLAQRGAGRTAAAKPPRSGSCRRFLVVFGAWCLVMPLSAGVFVVDGAEHAGGGMAPVHGFGSGCRAKTPIPGWS
jgi:hypothetical protein